MEVQQPTPQIPVFPSISNLLKRSWQVYIERFWVFLGIAILPFVLAVPLLFSRKVLEKNLIFGIFFFVFSLLLEIIVSLWSSVSLLYAIKDKEERIGVRESFRRGWSKIASFFWISVLTSFISTGGTLLFIVPGIIFSIWFYFSKYVLVSENFRGMNALFRSKQLVRGNWGKIFWRILVIWVISIFIYLCFTFPLTFLVGKKIGEIVGSVISFLFSPFSLTYSFLVYEDLKRLKGDVSFEVPRIGTKIGYILVGLLGFLLIPGILGSIVLTSLSEARSKARDAIRESNIRQFSVAQEMYYSDYKRYYTSGERDGLPPIPPYLVALDDPKAPSRHYKFLDNTTCDQRFCAYALMENNGRCGKLKRYFSVSEKGSKEICGLPPVSGCNCFGGITEEKVPEEKKAPEEIEKPSIEILSPNGGEILAEGQQFEIRWKTNNIPTNVFHVFNITLIDENGNHIWEIANKLPSTSRSYLWNVKFPYLVSGGKYKIEISTWQELPSEIKDESDDYFTIF